MHKRPGMASELRKHPFSGQRKPLLLIILLSTNQCFFSNGFSPLGQTSPKKIYSHTMKDGVSRYFGNLPIPRNSHEVSLSASALPQAPTSANRKRIKNSEEEAVPKTMGQALRVFFFQHSGPPLAMLSLCVMFVWRAFFLIGSSPLAISDAVAFGTAVVAWWVQEHFFHQTLLHSQRDWYGKQVHQEHHDRPYFHVSLDPAPLVLGWLLLAHLILIAALPTLPLALSATLGYAGAGLWYEWAHYIVHTRVPFSPTGNVLSAYFARLKAHHQRHHLVDSNFWLAFSVPAMDTLRGTNPNVRQIRSIQREQERQR